MKVLTITFARDGGVWSDKIISSFVEKIAVSDPNSYSMTINWDGYGNFDKRSYYAELIKKSVFDLDPDYVLLPDDQLYDLVDSDFSFLKDIRGKVVFAGIYSHPQEFKYLPKEKQLGVIQTPDYAQWKEIIKSVDPSFKKLKIIGGPFAARMSSYIKSKLSPTGLAVDSWVGRSWNQYISEVKMLEPSDAALLLYPFGCVDELGNRVEDANFKNLVMQTDAKTITFSRTKKWNSWLSIGENAGKIGENIANLVLSVEKGLKKAGTIEEITYRGYSVSPHISKRLGIALDSPSISKFFSDNDLSKVD